MDLTLGGRDRWSGGESLGFYLERRASGHRVNGSLQATGIDRAAGVSKILHLERMNKRQRNLGSHKVLPKILGFVLRKAGTSTDVKCVCYYKLAL